MTDNQNNTVQHAAEHVAAALDQFNTLRPAPRWQPISTAPKDGDHILLLTVTGAMVVGYWRAVYWTSVPGRWALDPTHWMPLPPRLNENEIP